MIRFYILLFMSMLSIYMYSQNLQTDTLKIDEVSVTSSRVRGASGFVSQSIDTRSLSETNLKSISDILGYNSSVYLKSYGAGGLSTSSIRGMGANHTRVLWEGIEISSPMLQQVDLSTIPALLFDNILLYKGAGGGEIMNTGPGGSLAFKSFPIWDKTPEFSFGQLLGSFGRIGEQLRFQYGSSSVSSKTVAYFDRAKNNYPYTDNYNFRRGEAFREDADYKKIGFSQDLHIKKQGELLSFYLHYSANNNSLPGPISSTQIPDNENQFTETLRVLFNYKNYKGKAVSDIKVAFISDWMLYTNKLVGINSGNKVNSIKAMYNIGWDITDDLELKYNITESYDRVKTVNYEESVGRNNLTVNISVDKSFGPGLGLIFIVKQQLVDNRFTLPVTGIGMEYLLTADARHLLKANLGSSVHIPSLNDLYWNPGGNPDLKDEKGLNADLAYSFSQQSDIIGMRLDASVYYSRIWDMIKWSPGFPAIWSPENIDDVRSKGLEFSGSGTLRSGEHRFELNTDYSLTLSERYSETVFYNDQRKQLIYTPINQGLISLSYYYRNLKAALVNSYTGTRYTSVDNSEYLDPYSMTSAILSYDIKLSRFTVTLNLEIKNISSTEYETIAWYPMPGRSFILGLVVGLK